MGGYHGHRSDGTALRLRRGPAVVLWVVVLAIVLATLGGVWALWPHQEPPGPGRLPHGSVHADPVEAVVLSVATQVCPGTTAIPPPQTADPATGGPGLIADASCLVARARLLSGPEAETIQQVPLPDELLTGPLEPGERVTLARFRTGPDLPVTYGWADHSRQRPLSVLAVIFLIVVVAVARWRGVTALAGLALGYLTIAGFMLPALAIGRNPLAVSLCGSLAIMVVILYVAHGVSAKTTTALLGTVLGLGLSGPLAWWAADSAHLNGLAHEDNLSLTGLPGHGLAGVILCGIILAGLGVLNDVTVTQASAVWEVAEQAPHLGVRELFASGMRVGRDHLGSTVYTIAFAYAGAALPTLMLIQMFRTPWRQVVTSGEIAEEVVRTLVGGIGLILAIPLTTLIAAIVAALGCSPGQPEMTSTSVFNRLHALRGKPEGRPARERIPSGDLPGRT